MFAGVAARQFRLRKHGVACDENGFTVGGVALLDRSASQHRASWRVRPLADLDAELTERYGLAVDISRKVQGIAIVARALDNGDIALAQIAALLLQFPDPTEFGEHGAEGRALGALATELTFSNLLKGDWNPDDHPRTGMPPNPGWFAPVPKASRPPKTRSDWPSRAVNIAIRTAILELVVQMAELQPHVRTAALALAVTMEITAWLRNEFPEEDIDPSQQRIADQVYASLQPPKALEELQTQPQDHLLGYEQHHIVEQNAANVAKVGPLDTSVLLKFGYEVLDDPSNLVWIPRLLHERVTAEYNSSYLDNSIYPLTREVVNAMDFNAQREAGLDALRRAGVLK
ncbi:MAG: hypothetical protein JO107_04550 [Hyphomicrobiales bacterium]|nr:hypothetical protein [Hyphomicrobiales bacterium]